MNKKDWINIFVISLFFLAIVYIIKGNDYLYGSSLDWYSQHYNFADYFRKLFYENKDIFPDFAFNIGAGQNIYNFSYYGFLSPIVLLSYLFPFINMQTWMIISIIFIVIAIIALFYYFIRQKYSSEISLFATLILISASPIIFHSHRHVMFMNYLPFLILSLIGVDNYFNKNKKLLLIISLFLLIMTSYYFSIGSILCIVIYGIYKYIEQNRKDFFKEGIKFLYPIIISILLSSILIIPTFYVILNGRGEGNNFINILELFKPDFQFNSFLYNPYNLGLTSVSLFFIISNLFNKIKFRFLSICILLITLFPIFTYILNATMYVEYKVLIPFLPLIGLLVAEGFNNIRSLDYSKTNIIMMVIFLINLYYNNTIFCLDIIVYLVLFNFYRYRQSLFPLLIYIVVTITTFTIVINFNDRLSLKKQNRSFKETNELLNYIAENDKSFYHIGNLVNIHDNLNKIKNLNEYSLNVYSSLSSKRYNEAFFDLFNNSIPYRNRAIVSVGNHYFFNNYIGIKYIIARSKITEEYELIKSIGNINLYKNPKAYPLGYVVNETMSYDKFNSLSYPYNVEILMNHAILNNINDSNYESKIIKYNLDIKDYSSKNININKENNTYIINSNNKGNLNINLKGKIENKILIIRFKILESPSCQNGDIKITINGISNKLTCSNWKYHNGNYQFDYVISNDLDNLNIDFVKGNYKINDIEMYILSKDELVNNQKGELIVDNNKTKGDNIEGNIQVLEDGYFILNIPYDKGFKIKVNDSLINYECANVHFIGFKLNKGDYNIKITYESPYKKVGVILSLVGLVLFIIEIRGKNGKNKCNRTML